VALSRRLLILAHSKTGKTTTPSGGVRGKTSGETFLPIKVRARLLEQERKRTGPWGMRWRVYLFGRAPGRGLDFQFYFSARLKLLSRHSLFCELSEVPFFGPRARRRGTSPRPFYLYRKCIRFFLYRALHRAQHAARISDWLVAPRSFSVTGKVVRPPKYLANQRLHEHCTLIT